MKNTKIKRVISTLLISGFLLGVPATVSIAQSTGSTNAKTASKTAQNPKWKTRQQFNIKPTLDKLVKAKTITAVQEAKIIAFENKSNATRTVEMQKLKNMTDAQRKAYFAKQPKPAQNNHANQFADLVKNKTITQKQADAINKAIAAARPSFGNRQK